MAVIQKIKKNYNQIEVAITYYSIISTINKLDLQKRELQLLAFMSIRGVTNPAARAEFCSIFKTSEGVLLNKMSSLKKKGLLVSDDTGRLRIHPAITMDFSSSIILQIILNKTDDPAKK